MTGGSGSWGTPGYGIPPRPGQQAPGGAPAAPDSAPGMPATPPSATPYAPPAAPPSATAPPYFSAPPHASTQPYAAAPPYAAPPPPAMPYASPSAPTGVAPPAPRRRFRIPPWIWLLPGAGVLVVLALLASLVLPGVVNPVTAPTPVETTAAGDPVDVDLGGATALAAVPLVTMESETWEPLGVDEGESIRTETWIAEDEKCMAQAQTVADIPASRGATDLELSGIPYRAAQENGATILEEPHDVELTTVGGGVLTLSAFEVLDTRAGAQWVASHGFADSGHMLIVAVSCASSVDERRVDALLADLRVRLEVE